MARLKIGALARRTGTNAPTIRYYEEIGLLSLADRHQGCQRVYGEDDVKRLALIRRCREFGFPIEQVKSLVAILDDRERSCLEVRDLARDHLVSIRGKLRELRALERSIARVVESCDSLCLGGPGPDCVVLETWAGAISPTDDLES